MSFDIELDRRLWGVFQKPHVLRAAKIAVEHYGALKDAGAEEAFRISVAGNADASAYPCIRAFAGQLCGSSDLLEVGTAVQWMLWRAGNLRISRYYVYEAFYVAAKGAPEKILFSVDERPCRDVLLDDAASPVRDLIAEVVDLAATKGVTIKDLAEEASIPYASLYSWYRGRRSPKKSIIPVILGKLREAFSTLGGNDGDQNPEQQTQEHANA